MNPPNPSPTFYLSPSGSDTAKGPWRSLPHAVKEIRKLRESAKVMGQVTLELAPGEYPLTQTVELAAEDSHLTIRAKKPGTAILEGGRMLSGWQETEVHGQRAWTLDLPEVASGDWYFRSLFVKGHRAPRARFPKFSADREGVQNCFRIGQIRFPKKRNLFAGDHYFKPLKGDFQNWDSLIDAEIVVLHYWTETRLPQPSFDPKTGWVRCTRRSVFNLYESFKTELARYYIDNLYEALTEPGEWYLDRRSGRLTYLPLPGETFRNTQIVAPQVVRFVRARGRLVGESIEALDAFGKRELENVRLEGLVFRHGDWFQPQSDFVAHDSLDLEDIPLGSSPQAASNVPAAVEFSVARNCSITDCAFEHLGIYGAGFSYGSRNCEVSRNHLRDLGAGGIRIWGADVDGHLSRRTGFVVVEDNLIEDIGRVFHQGTGILLGAVFDCRVAHNEIARACYTGISVGWSWGYRETVSRNNRIEWNHIHHIGQGVLSDMGGIYTLGVQPGTVLRGNHIHDVESHHYGGWGIYPDEGSSHLVIEDNLVHDTQGSPFFIHFGREMSVRNNVFIGSREEGLIGLGRPTPHCSATFLHNLLIGPAPFLYEGRNGMGLVRGELLSAANLVWFGGGEVAPTLSIRAGKRVKMSWAAWQRQGNDRTSIVADPRFVDAAKGDYRLRPGSPALALGFRAVDWSQCGVRPKKG